jgi:hypothetical protein
VITRSFDAKVLVAHDAPCDEDVRVELAYDEVNDPLAVTMTITVEGEGDVVWVFGRGLLRQGAQSVVPHGRGDVQFRALGNNWPESGIIACLKNAAGHADIGLPLHEVRSFLTATAPHARNISSDSINAHLDDALKEILGS